MLVNRRILERIIEANQSRDRGPVLEQLRRELEGFKVLARLCHESQGFSGTRAYLYVPDVVGLSKQEDALGAQPHERQHSGSAETPYGRAANV